jgi:hypothetical protein
MLISIDVYTNDEREAERLRKTAEAHGGFAEVLVLRGNEGLHVTGVYDDGKDEPEAEPGEAPAAGGAQADGEACSPTA